MVRQFNKYDLLKCIATVLVVIGHITILYNAKKHPEMNTVFLESVTTAIYIFHMPLFMAVSGSLYEIGFKKGKYREFIPFVKNKLSRLIVPYLCVGFLFLLPTLVLINADLTFSQPDLYAKIILAQDNRHLWFLLALFWIFIFQFIADKLGTPRWLIFCIALGLSYLKSFETIQTIAHLNQTFTMALHYWPYFILGIMIEDYDKIQIKQPTITLIGFLGAILCGGGKYLLDVFWMDAALHILCPCFIIIVFDVMARRLIKYIKASKWLTIFLDNSFAIYLFHVELIFIMHHYLRDVSAYILIPLMLVTSIILSICIAIVIRKLKLQFIIGEKYIRS